MNMLFQLDLRTLSLTLVLFSFIFGMGMLTYASAHKSFAGIRTIGIGHLLICVGFVLLGLRGVINDLASIVLSNLAFFIGIILVYRGLFIFLNIFMSFERLLSPILTILLAGLIYYYTFYVPDLNMRIEIFSSFFSAICFIAFFGLLKYQTKANGAPIKLLLGMFFIIGSLHLLRFIWAAYVPELEDYMNVGLLNSFTVLSSEFLVILTSFTTIWIATDKLQNKLSEMARTDHLTQLYNRRTFEEYCDVELSRTSRSNMTFSIIICDLDYFKNINDQHGHQVGDDVLKVFAEILRNNVRKQDVVARFGGEEFVLLLPDTDFEKALIVAEHLRSLTQSASVPLHDNSSLTFSASFGVSHYSCNDTAWSAVLNRADQALYCAKEQRNWVNGLNYADFSLNPEAQALCS